MYIGSTGYDGLHHMVKEIADNGIDEVIAGQAKEVAVTIHEDNSVTVFDNGRGIPVEIHPKTKKSTLETVLTVLHAGGKFGSGGYKISSGVPGGGLNGGKAPSSQKNSSVFRKRFILEPGKRRGGPTTKGG